VQLIMSDTTRKLLARIREISSGTEERWKKAEHIAAAIRNYGAHRWVGLYDLDEQMVSIIAWNGPGAPTYPTFPVTKGLTGAAIRDKKTVVVGDVRSDPRYLTAFGSTLSEIIIPILHPVDGRVIGTVDVESEKPNAFSPEDKEVLEQCAQAARPFWS
jgi:L-methionine (R)-S-oxide reductase